MIAKIKRHSENNTKKIILPKGGTNHVETIDLASNQIEFEAYVDHYQ